MPRPNQFANSDMLSPHSRDQGQQHTPPGKKLRTACDVCHQSKMKCSGGTPCGGCLSSGNNCLYSVSNRTGRPKGTKNKRTLERMNGRNSDPIDSVTSHDTLTARSPSLLTPFSNGKNASSSHAEPSSIDSVLSTSVDGCHNGTFEPFSAFTDELNPWYDPNDIAGASPFPHQSSPGATSTDDPPSLSRIYSQDSAIDIRSGNIFQDDESIASAPSMHSANFNDMLSSIDGDPKLFGDLTTSTSSSSLTSTSTCNCVQNNAELLCRLKELEQKHTRPRLDVVLSGAQQALVPWKSVIECRVCQHDDNQEVLVLSAMSIRSVLRSLHSLCLEHYNDAVSNQAADSQKQTTASMPDGMHSVIGMYEITGEERMAVKDLLIWRTLDKVKYTLACFKQRLDTLERRKTSIALSSPLERSYPRSIDPDVERLQKGGPSDLDHLGQLWRNLSHTVQTLERMLRFGEHSFIGWPGLPGS